MSAAQTPRRILLTPLLLIASTALADSIPLDNPTPTPPLASPTESRASLRWGVGVAPSIRVVSTPGRFANADRGRFTLHDTSFGLTAFMTRVGYQFPRSGMVAVSLFAEPRVSFHAKDIEGDLASAIGIGGSVAVEIDIGRYLYIAVGLSMGGELIKIGDSKIARGPGMGGLLLRVGARLPLSPSKGRPRALTVALDTMTLLTPTAVVDEDGDLSRDPKRTGGVATIGIAIGYDSY